MQFIRRLFGPSSKVSDPVSVTKVSCLSDSQINAVVSESNVTSSSLSGTTLTPASVAIEEAVNTEKFFSEITQKDYETYVMPGSALSECRNRAPTE